MPDFFIDREKERTRTQGARVRSMLHRPAGGRLSGEAVAVLNACDITRQQRKQIP